MRALLLSLLICFFVLPALGESVGTPTSPNGEVGAQKRGTASYRRKKKRKNRRQAKRKHNRRRRHHRR